LNSQLNASLTLAEMRSPYLSLLIQGAPFAKAVKDLPS